VGRSAGAAPEGLQQTQSLSNEEQNDEQNEEEFIGGDVTYTPILSVKDYGN